jgi:penicillin-binding protein 1A
MEKKHPAGKSKKRLSYKDIALKSAKAGTRGAKATIGLVLKIILTVFLIILCTGSLFLVVFSAYVKNTLSDEFSVTLSEFSLAQTSTIYYWDNGIGDWAVLDQLSGKTNSNWVSYEDLGENKYLEHAAVAIEDKRFYKHHGVDWYRTTAAFANMFLSMSDTFGGSTITQQLIKMLTEYDDVTVKRKLLEIFRALEFEKKYTKEEIMEAYLNFIYLGEGCTGVGAAAHEYFGKDAKDLSIAESACLIGITNNPSLYDPYISLERNRKRTEFILYEMYDQGYITEAEYNEAMAQQLVFTSSDEDEEETEKADTESVTSWYVDAVIEDVIADLQAVKNCSRDVAETLLYSAGYKIYAVVDKDIQDVVDRVYSTRDNLPAGYKKSSYQELQSAVVVMDPVTGDIKALSGGLGDKTASRLFNRATMMHRSPGSTIKPLASYSLCLDKGLVMPYTVFDDSDFVKLKGTDWYPDNDDGKNEGSVTLRYALQVSINTVAAQMIDMLTPRAAYDQLVNKLGFTHLVEDKDGMTDVSYAGMALGQLTEGVSVREMCQAYTMLCNKGIYTEARTYSRIEDAHGNLVYDNENESHVAVSETTAYYMTDMLTNAVNRGTGWLSKFGNMAVAGKSGGSSSWQDRWFIGYTPYLLAAVWTGYEIPENMGSSNPATGMWKQVMEGAHAAKGYQDASFTVPKNMVKVTVCTDTGLLATEACEHDIRGDRTMTLYMNPEAMPTTVCTAHKYVTLCKDSYGLFGDECPESSKITAAVLDLDGLDIKVTTPAWYPDGNYPKKVSWTEIHDDFEEQWKDRAYTEEQYQAAYDKLVSDYEAACKNEEYKLKEAVPYVLSEMTACRKHRLDPKSGWYVEYPHGYLVSPATGLYYDIEKDILLDPKSNMKQVDWKTGYLIDPETGDFIDPHTGNIVTLTEEQLAAITEDKYKRPRGYGNNADTEETEATGEESTDAEATDDTGDTTGGGDNADNGGDSSGGDGSAGDSTDETPPPTATQRPSSDSDLWYVGD